MILVVAFGLEAVMALVGEAFVWIKLIGAGYLVWIGWRMFTSHGELAAGKSHTAAQPDPLRHRGRRW